VGLIDFRALRDKAPIAPFPLTEDTMTTPRIRTLVSFAAALTVTLTLGACASAPAGVARGDLAARGEAPSVVRFENGAREAVRVYLIGEQREWMLGRVEPGARATLRIPDDALAGNTQSMRLAVLSGEHVTLRAAGEGDAAISMVQPASVLTSQRWTFSQVPTASGQLIALKLGR
jgi:hypothetical protein